MSLKLAAVCSQYFLNANGIRYALLIQNFPDNLKRTRGKKITFLSNY